ncbi:MAG TPA: hypothetical protein VGJ48_11985 [Pyrinomonadaceae bacterium]|jgi:hypothetical protein
MKRRTTKKILRKEEQNLAHSLKGFLANTDEETYASWLRELNSALAYLIATHLQLDRSWDHKQRWLDDIEWSSLSSSDTGLVGKGKIWWGYRINPSAALISVEFEARLQLRSTGRTLGIGYVVTFEDEGAKFCIRSRDASC